MLVTFAARTEEQKMKLKHYAALVELAAEEERKTLIDMATDTHRENFFAESRETLPKEMTTERVQVHMALLEQGIPITKLTNKGFVDLIEKPHHSLGGINGVRAVQPIVRSMVIGSAKAAVAGRLVGITFDVSKVNYSIEGMLARTLNDDFMPVSICVGVQALKTSLDHATLRTVIMKHLDEAGIAPSQIVAFSSDSGSPNPTAMRGGRRKQRRCTLGRSRLTIPCSGFRA
jgi:hypothetical protein